jgi:hypothetical protein
MVSENETPSDELASVDSAQSSSDPKVSNGDTDDRNEVNNSVSEHEDTTSSGTGFPHSDGNENKGDSNIPDDHEDDEVLSPERRYPERQ